MTQLNFEDAAPGGRGQRRVMWVGKLTGAVICVAAVVCAAIVAVTRQSGTPSNTTPPGQPSRSAISGSTSRIPGSYAGVDGFAQAVGRQPKLVTYYSPGENSSRGHSPRQQMDTALRQSCR